MLELLSRPLIIVFRFGIEMDEALRVGSSGFLGESDAGEADLSGFFKEFHGTFSGDEDVGGLVFGMDPVLLVLCGGYSVILVVDLRPLETRNGPCI